MQQICRTLKSKCDFNKVAIVLSDSDDENENNKAITPIIMKIRVLCCCKKKLPSKV